MDPQNLNHVIETLGHYRNERLESTRRTDEATGNTGARDLDAEAMESAIKILAALVAEGYTTTDAALELFMDYRQLFKRYQNLHKKFEIPAGPTRKDGVWHCPSCNGRVQINNTHCRRCGKKLRWGQ